MYNVDAGDFVLLPSNLGELRPMEITWNKQAQGGIRKASYVACHGYTDSRQTRSSTPRMGQEVLVFIALEMISDPYISNPGHVSNMAKQPKSKGLAIRQGAETILMASQKVV